MVCAVAGSDAIAAGMHGLSTLVPELPWPGGSTLARLLVLSDEPQLLQVQGV